MQEESKIRTRLEALQKEYMAKRAMFTDPEKLKLVSATKIEEMRDTMQFLQARISELEYVLS